ncbi:hypothetical protein GCM10027347_02920 [Larkinella harenae]
MGLATAPKIPERQRYLTIVIFGYETDPRIDDERIENAGRMGCNSAEISVHWDQVYNTRNSAPNWHVVDSHVNTALRMGMKVALRIHTAREPRFVNGFWGTEESMQAGDGTRMNFGGAIQFSFAHQPTLELVKGFVREVTQRYQYLQQQDNLLFMSTVASPIQEAEYSPRNGRGDTTYPIPFDYSEPMRQGFRQWLQGRFSLDALNRRWGSDFSRWEAVSPPPHNQQDPYISFNRGRWGEDWYVFRHLMLKRFIDETNRTIKEVNGSIQVVNQHGCVWDRQSGLRGTFAFRNLAQNADGVKINDGPDYNHRFSMDIVRSNVRPGAWICNEVDGMYYRTVSVDRFYQQVAESFEHGARMVTLANFGAWEAREPLNQVIQKVVNQGLLNQPVTQVQPASHTDYKLSSMVRDDVTDSQGRAGDQWSRSYNQNGRRPVNIVINEDWLEDNANQEPRVREPIPNQTAYVERPFEFNIPPATFEDPDGSITKIEITSGLPALGLSADGIRIFGTPNATGSITVTVRAIDNKNSPVTTQFQINVQGQNANQPPVVAKPIEDRTALVGQDYSFRIPGETFKDPDGRIVSIQALDLPAGLGYDPNTYTISGKPTAEGVAVITLKATDDKGTSVTTTFRLTMVKQDEVNKPPVVNRAIPAQTATVGQGFSYTIPNETFRDPDGEIVSLEVFGLTRGLYYEAESRTIKGTPEVAGIITIKVKATDNKGASISTDVQFTINGPSSGERLIMLEPIVDCTTGEITFRTSGGDGTKIEFRSIGITDWTTNPNSTIQPWLRNGVTFELQARQNGKEIRFTYTTPCRPYAAPVVAQPMNDQTYAVGQSLTLTIPLETFLASTALEISVSTLPEGLRYDKGNRTIAGTPTKAGTTTVTVTATDERGAKAEDSFVITVQKPAEAPLAMLSPTLNCQNGQLTIRTEGGNGGALSYSIRGVADWKSDPTFTLAQDKLKGANLTLLARQGDREVSLAYTTNCTTPGSSTLADQTIMVGQSYSYQLPDAGTGVSYTVSGLPDGLQYTAANRTIAGVPLKAGTTVLAIKAVDDKGNEIGQLTFKLIVVADPTTPPVKGNFEGFLDVVSCHAVAGWVWDQDRPNVPLTVEFLVGTSLATARVVGSIEANIFRQDLKNAGKGNGSHGYNWTTATELRTGQTYAFWARVQGSTFALSGSPKTLTCEGISQPTTPTTPTEPTTPTTPTNPGTTPVANQAPVAPVVADLTTTVNTRFQTVLPVFTDPEGGRLTYSLSGLPTGLVFDALTRGVSGTVTTAGSYSLTYTATDNQGAKTSLELALVVSSGTAVKPPVTNDPTTPPVKGNFEGFLDVVSCHAVAGWVWDQDRPNVPLTVEFLVGTSLATARVVGSIEANIFRQDLKNAGKGNGSHGYNWTTATELRTGQTYAFWARVQGSTFALSGSPKTLTCEGISQPTTPTTPTEPTTPTTPTNPGTTPVANQAPVAPVVADLTTTVNTRFLTILPVFTDPEGGRLTYSLSGLPAGLTFDVLTRGVSGTATTAGSYSLTYTATDSQGAKTSLELALTVNSGSTTTPNTPTDSPLVVLAPEYDCQTGRITFRTSGGDNTRIEYKAVGITDWTTTSTHTLYITMRQGITFDIEVRQSQKIVKYSYTTTCGTGKNPISDQVITKGLFYTFTLPETAAGVQLDVSGLPEGIVYNPSSRTSSGKPQNAGDYTVVVKSTTTDQKVSSTSFKLTVREPQLTVQLMKAGNAAARQSIQELTNNNTIGLGNLPDRVNFFCTSNVPVGSIAFELTGPASNNFVDNQAPFGAFGDDEGFKPLAGSYVLRISAYTGANGSGETIITQRIAFSFVQNGGRIGAVAGNAETAGDAWVVYPNPVENEINLTLPHSVLAETERVPFKFSLSSVNGGQWELREKAVEANPQKVTLDVQTLHLPTGMYFLQIQNSTGILKVIKVLKQ